LLVPIFRGGRAVYASPPLDDIRRRAQQQLASLDPAVRRLSDPQRYPVSLEGRLRELKSSLIRKARGTRV
jgi:nicotinate phosphoribosyltransferase